MGRKCRCNACRKHIPREVRTIAPASGQFMYWASKIPSYTFAGVEYEVRALPDGNLEISWGS